MQAARSRKLYLVALVGGLLCVTAGTLPAQQVTYNFMPGTDFSKYHTYKWVDIPSNVHPIQIVAQEIRDAVNNVLATKGFTLATSSMITNGMLAVDFYDPTSQQLIWRGSAAQTLNPSGNQEKDMKRLNKAVAKLLKHFPPLP